MIITPIIISFKIALFATSVVLVIGIVLARFLTKYSFKGKDIIETLIMLPMVIPPSVTGYGLLILVGRNGYIGKILYDYFGISIVFTWIGASLAAIIVSLPLMYQNCRTAFLNVDDIYENAARTLGANEKRIFWKITLPLARPGIISGVILSFARALGEFGATLLVAGNIPGKTQTVSIAIYFAVESGNTKVANTLMIIVLISSFIMIYGLNTWLKRKKW